MGMIQANLNQLMLSAWGSVATLAGIGKKVGEGFKKKPEVESPKVSSETTGSMGNIVKQGRMKRNPYVNAAKATMSANNKIAEKAVSSSFSVNDRLEQVKAASSLSIMGGNK